MRTTDEAKTIFFGQRTTRDGLGKGLRASKKVLWLMWIGLLSLALAACSSTGSGGGTEPNPVPSAGEQEKPPAAEQELEQVSIMLDWYPNAVHSLLYAALDQGYFTEEGLDVTVQMPAETNDPLRLVAANQVDLALNYQPQVVTARAEGIPVVSLAALVRHPLNAMMVKADSGIQSPKDLENKKVGYPSIPTNEAMIRTVMKADGSDVSKTELVDVGWDLIPAISTGSVDALFGAYINHEKVLLEKQGIPTEVIELTQYGVPDYYELVLVTGEETLENKKEVLASFWRALSKGHQFVAANPEQGLALLMASQNSAFPLEEDVEAESLEILLPLMDAGDKPFGYQDESSWQEVNDWLSEQGLLSQDVDVSQAFVNLGDK